MAASQAPEIMLAEPWKGEDPTGYWVSEKLDGIRTYWDGKSLLTRQGIKINAPSWFTEKLPKTTPLDGELWCGRGLFETCVSILKKKLRPEKDGDPKTSDWRHITYCVFDIPTPEDDYEVRLASLKSIITSSLQPHTVLVGVDRCKSADDLQSKLKAVQNVGGEGLMIRKPRSKYEPGRSNALLKVKAQRDAEAQVVGYVFKDGSDSVVKALMCQIPNGNEIVMGGSLLAAEPQLPDIGAVVTYKYQVLGEDGSPKAPSFFRVRNDITWDDVMNASGSKTKGATDTSKSEKKDPGLLFTKTYSSSLLSPPPPNPPIARLPSTVEAIEDDEEPIATRIPVADSRPICKYGATCYMKNPDHIKKFQHPPSNPGLNRSPSKATSASLVAEASDQPVKRRPKCQYGTKCYRKNPQHRIAEAHPGDDDWEDEVAPPKPSQTSIPPSSSSTTASTLIVDDDFEPADPDEDIQNDDDRPVCRYGSSCTRKNPQHIKEYRHHWYSKSRPKAPAQDIVVGDDDEDDVNNSNDNRDNQPTGGISDDDDDIVIAGIPKPAPSSLSAPSANPQASSSLRSNFLMSNSAPSAPKSDLKVDEPNNLVQRRLPMFLAPTPKVPGSPHTPPKKSIPAVGSGAAPKPSAPKPPMATKPPIPLHSVASAAAQKKSVLSMTKSLFSRRPGAIVGEDSDSDDEDLLPSAAKRPKV